MRNRCGPLGPPASPEELILPGRRNRKPSCFSLEIRSQPPEVPHGLPEWTHCASAKLNTNNLRCQSSHVAEAGNVFKAEKSRTMLLCSQAPPPPSTELRQLTSWKLNWSTLVPGSWDSGSSDSGSWTLVPQILVPGLWFLRLWFLGLWFLGLWEH